MQRQNSKSIKHESSQSNKEDLQQYHHQQNLNKDNQFFASVEKSVFIYLLQKQQPLIQSILFEQLTNEACLSRTIKKNRLVSYLKKIQQSKFCIQPQLFNKAFRDFRQLFANQILNTWKKLTEKQRDKYEQVGACNRKLMEQFEGGQKGNKYSGFQMFKIDILCVFFLYNNHYVKAFKDTKRILFNYDFITRVFNFHKSYIIELSQIFKQQQRDIHIDYRQELKDYVELLALIKLAYKLKNYIKTVKSSLQDIPSVNVQLDDNITDQTHFQTDLKFRLSQIACKSIAEMLKAKKYLQEQTPKISLKRKKFLGEISRQHNINIHVLIEIESKIDKKKKNNKQQFVTYFKKSLQKCQWMFLQGPSSIVEGFNAAFGNEFRGLPRYCGYQKIKLMSILTRLASQRFKLLSDIFKMQIKLEQKLLIYIYKFQYSLSDFKNCKQLTEQGMDEEIKDMKWSLVILVVNQQILSYSMSRSALTHDLYLSLVKLCLKVKVVKFTNQFNLVMYDFDYGRTLHTDAFAYFQIYMNKYYGARVYMLNDPLFFQPQFLVNSFLRSFLSQLELRKQNFYQYVEVCGNKLLKGIDKFDKDNNEQYFNYFKNIMTLQMGIRDVWKCFKKQKNNKYDAIILSGGEMEEQCPSNYLLLINDKLPSQQWFRSIQQCQPSFDQFIRLQEGEKWREIQLFKEFCSQDSNLISEIKNQQNLNTNDNKNISQPFIRIASSLQKKARNYTDRMLYSKNYKMFLQSKHMRENCIRRILKDATRFLIDYQLYFRQLVNGKRTIKQGQQTAETIDWLREFYNQQNKNIEQVYSPSQRESMFEEIAKKYETPKAQLQILKIHSSQDIK